jgi:hypothetical protein
VLEPDGQGSHWLRIDSRLGDATGLDADALVTLTVELSKAGPEPAVPADLTKALASDPKANDLWTTITPMACWDWLRWKRAVDALRSRYRSSGQAKAGHAASTAAHAPNLTFRKMGSYSKQRSHDMRSFYSERRCCEHERQYKSFCRRENTFSRD